MQTILDLKNKVIQIMLMSSKLTDSGHVGLTLDQPTFEFCIAISLLTRGVFSEAVDKVA